MRRRTVLAWLPGLALVVVGVGCKQASAGHKAAAALTPSPTPTVTLDSLSTELADQYRFVETNQPVFVHVPCYCGCGKTLGHRSLRDCFVRSQGVYDAHASGCGVCQMEATDVQRMLAGGMDVMAIRAAINARFLPMGTPTETE